MNAKSFLNDMNLNNEDKYYLLLLLGFSIFLTLFLIDFHLKRGAFNSDIYVYLEGALDLAGINYKHLSDPSWISNSPVILFLTSLLFRLGYVEYSSIFIVTGFFSILGIFSLYTFLKIRFSSLLSFTGAILYSSLSLTLYYFANGMLDIPAVSMIILTLVFTVMAVDKNPKYYILVAVSFSITFFIRFATAYIVFVIILYILKNHDLVNLVESIFYDFSIFKQRVLSFLKSKEFKYIFISGILGLIIFISVIKLLSLVHVDINYFSMAKGSINRYSNPYDANYVSDKWYFFKNFLNLLSCNSITFNKMFVERFNNPTIFSYLIVLILIVGFLLKFINCIKNINFFKTHKTNLPFRNKTSKIILVIFMVILLIIARIGFKFNYFFTIACLGMIFVILMSLVREFPINKDHFSLFIMCLSLFSFYLVVVSYIDLKCFRYILPAFPAFVYFVIYALNYIMEFISYGFDNEQSLLERLNNKCLVDKSGLRNNFSKVFPVILILICLFFIFTFPSTVDMNEDGFDRIEFCDFIKEYDPDYPSKDFLCLYDVRYFEWYLDKDINQVDDDNWEIKPYKYDYIITFEVPFEDDNFKEVYHEGLYYLNEKQN